MDLRNEFEAWYKQTFNQDCSRANAGASYTYINLVADKVYKGYCAGYRHAEDNVCPSGYGICNGCTDSCRNQ